MLKGKTAIVTGGSRGIGAAICKRFAEQGANIALLYAGNTQKAEETKAALQEMGVKAEAYQCNVADAEQVAAVCKQIMMKVPDFDSVVDTNLKGAFYMIKQLYPVFMKQKSGKIINISSVSGLMGNPGQTNYSASKAGLIGLTKSVAKELASRNVNCNAIAPGFVATDMTENLSENNALVDHIPMKRFAQPEDIANLALFLSDYITGEVIRIDGGLAM